ncbi:hypothetical protein MTY81_14450 [Mycolicibacterium sp. TY81]|nr:hypothetical protein MTY81_14450 [Mycolicibacterium sp. TY81]
MTDSSGFNGTDRMSPPGGGTRSANAPASRPDQFGAAADATGIGAVTSAKPTAKAAVNRKIFARRAMPRTVAFSNIEKQIHILRTTVAP